MNIFLIVVVSLSILLLSYSWFLFCANPNKTKFSWLQCPVVPFLCLGLIGCVVAYFLTPNLDDAVFPTSFGLPIIFFTSATALWLGLKYINKGILRFLLIFSLCLLNLFLLPSDFSMTENLIPWQLERIVLAAIWTIFAILYPNMNGLDGILSIHALSLTIGILLLYIIGVLPALYGYYDSIFIALFISFNFFNRYPEVLHLNKTETQIIGLLLGWLCILASLEGDSSCILILNMYYIYEIISSFFRKILQPRKTKLVDNTFYNVVASAGIAPNSICDFITRINLVLLLLAGFQIYSPNYYTICILSLFSIFWIISRVNATQQTGKQHLLITGSIYSMLRKGLSSTQKDKKDK